MKKKFSFYIFIFFFTFTSISFSLSFESLASNLSLPNFDTYVKNDDGTEKYYHVTLNNSHNDDSADDYYELHIVKYIPHNIEYDKTLGYVSSPQYTNYSDQYMSIYQYKPSVDSDWVHVASGNNIRSINYGLTSDTYFSGAMYDKIILYSNYDIVVTSDNLTFFQKPRTLARILQTIPATIRTGILSQVVYLIPYLISLVIGLISFHKVWRWLRIQLSI